MIQALNTAAVGMKSQQLALDTVANNIANINTVGYKKDRVNFQDALYVRMQDASNADSTANLQKGTGALIGSVSKIFTATSIMDTGAPLDVALETQEAFFVLEDSETGERYTRDGNFQLSEEDGGNYLVTQSGEYVLDTNRNRIAIDCPMEKLHIDERGNITDGRNSFGRLATVTFANTSGLEKMGGNTYRANASSGAAENVNDAVFRQGYLENSNVDLGQEVTNMIKAQRAYQLASRILTVSDQMEEKANNLRR